MGINVCKALSSISSWPNVVKTDGSSCGESNYEKDPDQLSTIDLQASRKRQVKLESKLED